VTTVHRIWISPDGAPGMPSDFVEYGRRWLELNPDAKLHDWTHAELQELPLDPAVLDVVEDLRGRSPNGMTESLACQLADVYSYCLLRLYGGVYVNCDIDPVRPLSALPVDPSQCWACWENPEFLVNAAMGGPARHLFWDMACYQLPRRYFSMPGAEMNQATGPHLLTAVYRSYPNYDFVPLPRETFNPYMWNDIPANGKLDQGYSLSTLPDVTVGVHHWAHRRTMRSNVIEEGKVWSASSQ
jgi:mannosyltransferase OCH1-like enzyme